MDVPVKPGAINDQPVPPELDRLVQPRSKWLTVPEAAVMYMDLNIRPPKFPSYLGNRPVDISRFELRIHCGPMPTMLDVPLLRSADSYTDRTQGPAQAHGERVQNRLGELELHAVPCGGKYGGGGIHHTRRKSTGWRGSLTGLLFRNPRQRDANGIFTVDLVYQRIGKCQDDEIGLLFLR